MTLVKRVLSGFLLALSINSISIFDWMAVRLELLPSFVVRLGIFLLLLAVFIKINISPQRNKHGTKGINILSSGNELLRFFLISVTLTCVGQIYMAVSVFKLLSAGNGAATGLRVAVCIVGLIYTVFGEAVVFWNGMIRVYLTSIQLGIKHRVLAAICGWIPIVNIVYLNKIIKITTQEIETETQKFELDVARENDELCKTKYPILLVHGVFFRDFRYLNYWGRISTELKKNGASIYYGEQQSAASVEASGEELAKRIKEIVDGTGCEKVNIIAHSKGGLDSRAAISHFDCAPYVASLTTINTPHKGCIFAEYLLKKIPEKARLKLANTYNSALKNLGDKSPDFIGAVTDLTESRCITMNENTPDSPEVLYESVMSYCKKARSGKFPLNVSYPLVRHFDGKNDGLVSLASAQWGSKFTLVEPKGKRGISHGDMIDLNRENIDGFDVREFYVSLVSSLKNRGY